MKLNQFSTHAYSCKKHLSKCYTYDAIIFYRKSICDDDDECVLPSSIPCSIPGDTLKAIIDSDHLESAVLQSDKLESADLSVNSLVSANLQVDNLNSCFESFEKTHAIEMHHQVEGIGNNNTEDQCISDNEITPLLDEVNCYIASDKDFEDICNADEYDSCSDYESEMHDEHLYENVANLPLQMCNPCFDSGQERYAQVDDVAESLNLLITQGIIPENHIYYMLLKNINNYIYHNSVSHKDDGIKFIWDPVVVDWCNSILYLGGNKVYNFLRGPGNFRQGRDADFNLERFNLPLPDERTCRRHNTVFSTQPGINRELLLNMLLILKAESIEPLIENSKCILFGVNVGRDGIGLKPELSFDPVRKVLVGSTIQIDIDYVKNNPSPDLVLLKKSMIKDGDTIVVTDLTNRVSLPIGIDYSTHFQTGEEVKQLVQKRMEEIQMCYACIQQVTDRTILDNTILNVPGYVTSA